MHSYITIIHYFFKVSEVNSLSHVRLFATPWTIAYQGPQSMGCSRQEYWSGLPFPSPGDLPDPGIEPRSPALQADALPLSYQGSPKETPNLRMSLFYKYIIQCIQRSFSFTFKTQDLSSNAFKAVLQYWCNCMVFRYLKLGYFSQEQVLTNVQVSSGKVIIFKEALKQRKCHGTLKQ